MSDVRAERSGLMRRPMPRFHEDELPLGSRPPAVAPAPKPWPIAPILAIFVCLSFLMLQLWPATHYRHPFDPHRTWYPVKPTANEEAEESDPTFVEPNVTSVELNDSHVLTTGGYLEKKSASAFLKQTTDLIVHVFLCTDASDPRPLAVVINSTITNTKHPERFKFHLVTPGIMNNQGYVKLQALYPTVSIEVLREPFDMHEITKHIVFRKESRAREELANPYNFLPFYLPGMYNNVDRFIYLDSDVVVKGDLEELFHTGMDGHPVAAVEDCSQIFRAYFDFKQLRSIQAREAASGKWWLPDEPFDEKTCLFNRGVLLIDSAKWRKQNLTEAIEWWLDEFHNASKVLYRYGVSQPPFLLAVYKNYKKLDLSWNTRGLGRNEFSEQELDYMEKNYNYRPHRKPFISPLADYAKIFHFNGKFKPWNSPRRRPSTEDPVSLCGQRNWDCAQVWWDYLSPIANDLLTPISLNQ